MQLLADIRAVWPEDAKWVTTQRLLTRLFRVETSPWSHEWGENHREVNGEVVIKPNRAAAMKLAKALRPFEVKPRNVGPETDRIRGYHEGRLFRRFFSLPPFYTPRGCTGCTSRTTKPKTGLWRLHSRRPAVQPRNGVFGSTKPTVQPVQPQPPGEGGGKKTGDLVGVRVRCSKHDTVTTVKSITAGIAYFACGCFVTPQGRP